MQPNNEATENDIMKDRIIIEYATDSMKEIKQAERKKAKVENDGYTLVSETCSLMKKEYTPTPITAEPNLIFDILSSIPITEGLEELAMDLNIKHDPEIEQEDLVDLIGSKIVKAVNCHEELVRAATLAKEFMESILGNDTLTEHEQAVYDAAYIALTKAKGT